MPEHRHLRSTSLNITPQNSHSNGSMSPMAGGRGFEGPRSPPNTSHVPCKFYRQGTCQAGNACPFNHDIGAAAETICKYFAKGNCKFGPKCANIHVLPDGRRVNYGGKGGGITLGAHGVNLGSRINPSAYPHSSNSALTNSFMSADNVGAYRGPYPANGDTYSPSHQLGRQPSMENGIPAIDTTYSSNPASAYGSPRDDELSRHGLALSPHNKFPSVRDVGLPASFDSNGISHAAKPHQWPASVPSQFMFDHAPSSHGASDQPASETLKLLHTSAFGSSEHLSPSNLSSHDLMGSSPPLVNISDELSSKRAMHSTALRFAKPRNMSSSVPRGPADSDWDTNFQFEEDYVPGNLANEVLTPQEKARRGSLRASDGEGSLDAQSATINKYGSPVGAASPSRWGPLFQRQREEDSESGSLARAMRGSAFGHVGSPLRNSSLAIDDEYQPAASNGRPSVGSRSGSESFSTLTQQLQRTRISEDGMGGPSPHLHPNTARHPSGSGVIGKERDRDRALERHVSSGSIGSSTTGRFHTPIDEGDSAFVFSMEEEEELSQRTLKRKSGGLGTTVFSYANIAAGKHPNTAKGRDSSNIAEMVGGR